MSFLSNYQIILELVTEKTENQGTAESHDASDEPSWS